MSTKQQQQGALVARSAFPRQEKAIGPARDWATKAYRLAGGTPDQAETCALVVSELATNAVLHAEGARFDC